MGDLRKLRRTAAEDIARAFADDAVNISSFFAMAEFDDGELQFYMGQDGDLVQVLGLLRLLEHAIIEQIGSFADE